MTCGVVVHLRHAACLRCVDVFGVGCRGCGDAHAVAIPLLGTPVHTAQCGPDVAETCGHACTCSRTAHSFGPNSGCARMLPLWLVSALTSLLKWSSIHGYVCVWVRRQGV